MNTKKLMGLVGDCQQGVKQEQKIFEGLQNIYISFLLFSIINKKKYRMQVKAKKLKPSSMRTDSDEKQQCDISDEDEKKQKDRIFVTRKLLSSLQQSLQNLLLCLVNNNVHGQIIEKIIRKRRKDKILNSYLNQAIIQKDKEEYCSVIYFKMKSELRKFPQDVYKYLTHIINGFYNEMVKGKKIDIVKFYRFLRNKIDEEIDKIVKINDGGTKMAENETPRALKEEQIEKIVQHMYGILELDIDYIKQNMLTASNNYFIFLEDQYKRNEQILRHIIKFGNRMKKQYTNQRVRILSMNQNIPKKVVNNFKVKRSISNYKIKENKQVIGTQKQNNLNRIYLKPILKSKVRLKI